MSFNSFRPSSLDTNHGFSKKIEADNSKDSRHVVKMLRDTLAKENVDQAETLPQNIKREINNIIYKNDGLNNKNRSKDLEQIKEGLEGVVFVKNYINEGKYISSLREDGYSRTKEDAKKISVSKVLKAKAFFEEKGFKIKNIKILDHHAHKQNPNDFFASRDHFNYLVETECGKVYKGHVSYQKEIDNVVTSSTSAVNNIISSKIAA